MKRIVFYSWQSDLSNAANRGFIQQALEAAAQRIASDKSVEIEPVVDRDTQGVSGSPDIASTIFAKIDTADVVVADVTLINKPRKGRPTPNPNVLIELGYALKARGADRVLLVFNDAFGKLPDLPFDLRMRRVITYTQLEINSGRATERNALTGKLEAALRSAFAASPVETETSATSSALSAIENAEPKRIPLFRRALGDILARLDAAQPKLPRIGGTFDDLLSALGETKEVVADIARLSEAIALMSDESCALELYKWFSPILERYNPPRDFSGHYNRGDFDYFKFLGYEMFVNMVATLLRESRWAIIQPLLSEPIPMRYVSRNDGPGSFYWDRLSDHPPLIMGEGDRKNRLSLLADLIKERHESDPLGKLVSFEDFMGADFFLYLRTCGSIPPTANTGNMWRPWCVPYLDHMPQFLNAAGRHNAAVQLAKTMGAPSVEALKDLISKSLPTLGQMFSRGFLSLPFRDQDIQRIGSAP